MPIPLRVPYSAANVAAGEIGFLPHLPITLRYQGQVTAAAGLVDTGAAINVLPYSLGLALGATWSDKPATLQLAGNLARVPARPLVVSTDVGPFAPVQLVFAWTQADDIPLLLGQVNFFLEFDVCFYRAQRVFEVQPKR